MGGPVEAGRDAGGASRPFVAITSGGEVAASCGVVVTEGRGRYQAVDTATEHRRQGIARRLVYEAGRHAAQEFGARQLLIAADVDYHACASVREWPPNCTGTLGR